MRDSLYYNTVTPYLKKVLKQLMVAKELEMFRLVGGTSLSLQIGHRLSVDIDLFTDQEYGSVNFKSIDNYLRKNFPYIQTTTSKEIGMGKSYFIGESKNENEQVKLDLFYTEEYITAALIVDSIRLASIEDIIAMKLEVIGNGGRKKDFWDIHGLMSDFTFSKMLELYEKKYPYSHDEKTIKKQFQRFEIADNDPDPICLQNKHWEVIKLDMIDFVKT